MDSANTLLLLVGYFVPFILIIVLFGVLVKEYFNRKGKKKEGILGWLIVLFFGSAFVITDIYRSYLGILDGFVFHLTTVFSVITAIGILIQGFLYWKKIHKGVFWTLSIFSITAIFVVETVRIYKNVFLDALNVFSIVFSTIGFYFLIISFLIGEHKVRKRKSKNNLRKVLVIMVGVFLVFSMALYFSAKDMQEVSGELNIYNWEDYFAEDVLENFEEEFGVKINLELFEDEDVLLSEDLGGYDLVITSDVIIRDMAESDLLEVVDKSNIPNFKYIDKKCIKEEFNNYVVPYFWGTTGLAINTKYVPEDTNSWDPLWSLEYKGKIAVLNNPTEVIGMATRYTGLPLVPQTKSQFKQIEKFLLIQKPLLVGYESEQNIRDLLASGELWAAQIYDGIGRQVMLENEDVKYIIPKEGASEWVDNFVIMKGSPNKHTAEIFIDYILRPEVSAAIADYQMSYSCNSEAMKLVESSLLEEVSEGSLKFLEYFSDYTESAEMKGLRSDLWERLYDDAVGAEEIEDDFLAEFQSSKFGKGYEEVVIVGGEFYPGSYVNETGELDGHVIEIAKVIFDKMGIAYEIKLMDWAAAQEEMKDGKANVLLDASYEKSREEFLYFSENEKNWTEEAPETIVTFYSYSLFSKGENKDNFDVSSFEVMARNGYSIGIVTGLNYVYEIIDKGLNFYLFDNRGEIIRALDEGEIDLMIEIDTDVFIHINEMGLSRDIVKLKTLRTDVSYISFSKESKEGELKEIREDFYEELREMKASGEFMKIIEKNYGELNLSVPEEYYEN